MSGRATGDDSGLIDLDSLMKGTAPAASTAPAAPTPPVRTQAQPPASAPAPRPRADDSLAVAAVTTDRPPPSLASVPYLPSPPSAPAPASTPSVEGPPPIMSSVGAASRAPSTGRRSTTRTVAIVAAGLALVAGTLGVARMRSSSHTPAVAAASPHDPPREKNNAPSSQPSSNAAAPASPPESDEPTTPVGALGHANAGTAASARARSAVAAPAHVAEPAAANAELHTADLPTAPGGGSLDLGGAMKSAVNATDDVAATTGDPSGGSKARTVRPSPGAVLGALNAVLPAARACLSPDEAMRSGTVVFASSGAVSRVDLAGNKGSDGCIRDAISRARIEPFADDSFTTRITIRP